MQRKIIVLMVVTILLSLSGFTAFGQTKEEEEKKKQEKLILERQIEAKERADQERERIIVETEEIKKAVRKAREAFRDFDIPDLPESPVFFSTGSGREGAYFVNGSHNTSSLQFSKQLKEASFTKDFEFEIEEGSRRASINISGMCDKGEIRIEITQPSGKSYTEVLIDEFGSVNWSKSFSIDEDDNSKTGKWVFQIVAREATGNFRLSLRSN